jgi:S-DNA-T family DNA segregation ATPase FtsK/SpoIIIE
VPRHTVDVEPGLVPLGVEETALAPVGVDLFGAEAHLLVLGDGESGRTNLLRALALGLAERLRPDALELHVIDPRRTLADLAELPHVAAYAPTLPLAAQVAERLSAAVAERLPDGADPAAALAGPPAGAPRLVLLVDDYDLLAGPAGSPLAPLAPSLAVGRDAGLHVLCARRVAGTTRAAFESFLQKLLELRSPGILLAGDPAEGPVLDGHRASPQPPGRGLYVRRGRRPTLVQTVFAPAPDAAGSDTTSVHLAGRTTTR